MNRFFRCKLPEGMHEISRKVLKVENGIFGEPIIPGRGNVTVDMLISSMYFFEDLQT